MDTEKTCNHFSVYTLIISLCCTLKTNTMLRVNYVSVKVGEKILKALTILPVHTHTITIHHFKKKEKNSTAHFPSFNSTLF